MTTFPKVAVALALAIASTNAVAQFVDDSPPQKRVSYNDLNLASAEGVKALQNRVRSAAKSVCDRGSTALDDKLKQRDCERKALDEAEAQIAVVMSKAGQTYAMIDSDSNVSHR